MIERIDNVGVAVSDLARSADFYRRLGFAVEEWEGDPPAAMLRAGGVQLYAFQTNLRSVADRRVDLSANPVGFDHVSLWVGDVDAACARIVEAGVELETQAEDQDWGYRAAGVLDPDGNRLFLLGDLKG
jgi:catechol 2,3-dioxygenase-like lactoylglutathione lyase family enzyme